LYPAIRHEEGDRRLIKAELLRDATDDIIKRLAFDEGWVFEEKHNGDRRLIEKQGTDIRDYNRNGDRGKGLPGSIVAALRKHPLHQFVIDVELVYDEIFPFDTLCLGDEILAALPYSYRKSSLHAQFDGFSRHIIPVESARMLQEKVALIQRLKDINAEGFVAKELNAPYRPAENNQRYNYRYKFTKTCDCIVIGRSPKGHDSVRVGLFDSQGKLHDIGGVSLVGKENCLPGDIVEVKYLWASRNNHIVQPRLVRKRPDKEPTQCILSQLVKGKGQ
jgi:ATP-dependent DNA ligase